MGVREERSEAGSSARRGAVAPSAASRLGRAVDSRPHPDEEIVSRQLSRRDVQDFKVCVRCPAKFPMVIQNQPVTDRGGRWRVFTTMYWLTCPALIRHLSKFESAGWIGKLEAAAESAPGLRQAFQNLHDEYAFRRRRLVGARMREKLRLERPTLFEALDRTGIAGVSRASGPDEVHIKCLHAHAAYHLVHGDHPVFSSFPELLTDVSACRECEHHVHAV